MKQVGSFWKLGCALSAALLVLVIFARHGTGSLLYAADNPIVIENQQPGSNQWQLGLPGFATADDNNQQIKGYASAVSVNKGSSITFYVTVNPAQTYAIDIYRMGWYNGLGGRLLQHVGSLNGTTQAACPVDSSTGLIACRWTPSYTLTVPSTWVDGVYLAVLTNAQNYQNRIVFVVRDDQRVADFLFQQSVTTYQAYNNYPDNGTTGKSLYDYNSYGANTVGGSKRAVKVSFDRPYADEGGDGQFEAWEKYLIHWLERSGYDVTYTTDIDTHVNGARLLNFKGILIGGHDEYWTQAMRTAVENARDSRVNLGFFSANDVYWQIRLEASAGGVANRVVVCYKDYALDPNSNDSLKTTTWRSYPLNLPEQSLIGVQYTSTVLNNNVPYVVSNSSHWVYAGTGFRDGDSVPGIVGYENDNDFEKSPLPAGTGYTLLANSPYTSNENQPDHHNASIYQAPSGAWVFGSGTMSWSWGLDHPDFLDARIQRTTSNILNQFLQTLGAATPTPAASPTASSTATATSLPTNTPTPGGNIKLRSVSSGNNGAGSTSLSLNAPAGLVANDVLIAHIVVQGATTSITPPGGWHLIRRDNTGTSIGSALYYRVVGGSEPPSYAWAFNSTQKAAGGIAAYSGVDPVAPIDAHSGQYNPATATITAPSVTTTAAFDELLFIAAIATGTTVSPPAGMTQRWTVTTPSTLTSSMADQGLGGAGATGNKVGTSGSSSDSNIGQLVALRLGTAPPVNTATTTPTTIAAPTSTPTMTAAATSTPTATAAPTGTQTATAVSTSTPTTAAATSTPTAIAVSTSTPTATPTSASSDLIFADGFESGNLAAWSSATQSGGSLSVTTAAALVGSQGLQVTINSNTPTYVVDMTPNAEPRYRARFYFDPHSISMVSGNAHYIFYGSSGSATVVLRIEFRYQSPNYQIRAALVDNGSTWKTSSWSSISNARHFIEIDWAASAAGASNGYLTLWIDGVQKANLTGVSNDTRRVDQVKWGAVAGIDSGTRGTYYMDAFESRRQSSIGPAANQFGAAAEAPVADRVVDSQVTEPFQQDTSLWPKDIPEPQLSLAPEPAPTRGGLGSSRAVWESVHGPGSAQGAWTAYEGGRYRVRFNRSNVWRVEWQVTDHPSLSLSDARQLAKLFMPPDTKYVMTYSPREDVVADVYYSDWLKAQFDPSAWSGDRPPGTFVIVYWIDDAGPNGSTVKAIHIDSGAMELPPRLSSQP